MSSPSTPSSPPSSLPASLPSSPPQGTRRLSQRPSPLNPASPALNLSALPVSPLTPTPNLPSLPGAPISAPPLDRQKSRARDLLRKHYGMGVGPPAPLPGRAQDPMDLGTLMACSHDQPALTIYLADSSVFDAKAYYDQLITTSSLPMLLKRENELLTGALIQLRIGGNVLSDVLFRDSAA